MEDIRKRIEELKNMRSNAYRIAGMYATMRHPNKDKLEKIYTDNAENISREIRQLERKMSCDN